MLRARDRLASNFREARTRVYLRCAERISSHHTVLVICCLVVGNQPRIQGAPLDRERAKGRRHHQRPFWGGGFVLMCGALWPFAPGFLPRKGIAVALACCWGLRYAIHLFSRSWGHSEQTTYYPYKEWRARAGKHFWWVSWFRVFMPEGIGITVVEHPFC